MRINCNDEDGDEKGNDDNDEDDDDDDCLRKSKTMAHITTHSTINNNLSSIWNCKWGTYRQL